MSDLAPIGEVLVRYSASTESSGPMTLQLRAVHDRFIRTRDAEGAYFQMGFLAAKAIERCRQLEESHAGDRDLDPDRADDRAGARARQRPPTATRT